MDFNGEISIHLMLITICSRGCNSVPGLSDGLCDGSSVRMIIRELHLENVCK